LSLTLKSAQLVISGRALRGIYMDNYDCIVIGAGPAGLTAATLLARSGMDVIVIERGEYPGAKNMFGGVLYSRGLEEIFPEFWKEAPVERPVARWVISFLNADSSFSIDYKSRHYSKPPYNAFTVLRSKFDRWHAQKAEAEGVTLVTKTTVLDLIKDNGVITGVKTDREQGDLFAPVVIAADGVNSIVKRNSILGKDLVLDEVSLGVKEILALPEEDINRNFSLSDGEGMARTFVGAATDGVPGGGFIYTNRESISIGVVVKPGSLIEKKVSPEDLLDNFKNHDLVKPIVKNGVRREYSAHLIPEGGSAERNLYADGLIAAGDAAGFTLSTGFRTEGVNYSIMSGAAAAEAVKSAGKKNDFSAKSLSVYVKLLKDYGLLSDFKKHKNAPEFFKNPRLYETYPDLICKVADDIFTVLPGPKDGIFTKLKKSMKGRISWFRIIKDCLAGWRAIL